MRARPDPGPHPDALGSCPALGQVCEDFALQTQTAGLAVSYFDRYVSGVGATGLCKARVQLLAITCLMIAAKFVEIMMPGLDDLCEIAHNKYSKEELKSMELETLGVLRWELRAVTPHDALQQLAIVADLSSSEAGTSVLQHAEFFVDMSYYEVCAPPAAGRAGPPTAGPPTARRPHPPPPHRTPPTARRPRAPPAARRAPPAARRPRAYTTRPAPHSLVSASHPLTSSLPPPPPVRSTRRCASRLSSSRRPPCCARGPTWAAPRRWRCTCRS